LRTFSKARTSAAEAAVHVDDLLLGDAETLGDHLRLTRAQMAVFQGRDAALSLAEVE
jgi:hypothetical protein